MNYEPRAEEIPPLVKCLPHRHKDLILILRSHIQNTRCGSVHTQSSPEETDKQLRLFGEVHTNERASLRKTR